MKFINIRDVEDSFERYQMPILETRIKHQGQYHQTYLLNLQNVAKSLKVDLGCLVKYFGWSFNTIAKLNQATGEIELKGTYDDATLLKTLRKFINQYVLCRKCTLPELDYVPKKNMVGVLCRACGYKCTNDLTDRVYKIMYQSLVDNPPSKNGTTILKKQDPTFDDFPLVDDDHNNHNNDIDINWISDISNEAIEARRQETIGQSRVLDKLLI